LQELAASVAEPARAGLLALPELYGGAEVLEESARRLPATAAIAGALDTLRRLARDLADLPIGFDLADLRGYHYHNGVVFAAYCDGSPGAVALGGRYDKVGEAFGRARAATGFSIDLRDLARLAQRPAGTGAILAPWPEDAAVHAEVERLRSRGETVVLALPGHDGHWREAGCDRKLLRRGNEWTIESLKEE
jgi:ATP phosphoribosyltransferase regulatory subunit